MTERQAALVLLVDCPGPERAAALDAFYRTWRNDPLVLDKWFGVQALSALPDTALRVEELSRHPDFSLGNPNRARALVGSFAAGNAVRFHGDDGRGYEFLADVVLELDPRNPQLASSMVSMFSQWRRYDAGRGQLMEVQLERIASQQALSKDVYEMVARMLS